MSDDELASAAGMEFTVTVDDCELLRFQEWVQAQICAIFGLSADELGVSADMNRAAALGARLERRTHDR